MCRIRRRQEIGRYSLQRFSERRAGKKFLGPVIIALFICPPNGDADTENGSVVADDISRASHKFLLYKFAQLLYTEEKIDLRKICVFDAE